MNHALPHNPYRTCCTALECTSTKTLLQEKGKFLEIPLRDALWDRLGFPWCKQCYRRYDLINWAYEHNWPEVHCPPYKVGANNDFELWKAAIFFGTQEFILTLHAHIFSLEITSKNTFLTYIHSEEVAV